MLSCALERNNDPRRYGLAAVASIFFFSSLWAVHPPRRFRVHAALRAAAERPAGPLTRAALRAGAARELALRRDAAVRAWRDRAVCDAARRDSRFRTRDTARATRGQRRALRRCCPTA